MRRFNVRKILIWMIAPAVITSEGAQPDWNKRGWTPRFIFNHRRLTDYMWNSANDSLINMLTGNDCSTRAIPPTLLMHLPPHHTPTRIGLSSCHERKEGEKKKKLFDMCWVVHTWTWACGITHVWQLRTFQHKSINFQQCHYRYWLDSKPKQTSKIYINTIMFVICLHPHIGHSKIGFLPNKF